MTEKYIDSESKISSELQPVSLAKFLQSIIEMTELRSMIYSSISESTTLRELTKTLTKYLEAALRAERARRDNMLQRKLFPES